MKVYTYLPRPGKPHPAEDKGLLPVEALAEAVLNHQSLYEALEVLQREGYRNRNGENIFTGIADLLEEVINLREELARLLSQYHLADETKRTNIPLEIIESLPSQPASGGPPLSGQHIDRRSLHALMRLIASKKDTSSLTLRELLMLTEHFHRLEQFEKDLKRVYWGYDLESIDESLVEDMLGEVRKKDWQAIKNLASHMVQEGYVEKRPSGLRLTSKGLQKIASHILKEIFRPRKNNPLSRQHHAPSAEIHFTNKTRPYQFGDPLLLDMGQSVLAAVKRKGTKLPVRFEEEDFIIYDKDIVSMTATVLLIDLSKSMQFENRYIAAKKVALALYELIRKRYPKDRLAAVGFSMEARKVKRGELPFLTWDDVNPYTNMEAALDAAKKTLSLHKGLRRQILLITDGEPTAHREKGYTFFQFPPHPKTLHKTLRAVQGLKRQNIALSIFLLSQEKSTIRFVEELAKKSSGKVFHISPHDLGQCVLMDYIDRKRKRV